MKKPDIVPESDSESNDSDYGEDMLEMVENDDLEFLKHAVTSKSYNIFNKIKYTAPQSTKAKREKVIGKESEQLENDYEDQTDEEVPMKSVLPIKTKHGIIPQQIVDESANREEDEAENEQEEAQSGESDEEEEEEQFSFIESGIDLSQPISATQLLTSRSEALKQKKIHIGTLSAGILENPEEKVTNFRSLLKLMDEEAAEVYFTVRKLTMASLLDVFKDILPSYEIKNVVDDGVKLKKDTLKLHKYEENLLQYYKKYLQKLEKISGILIKKKGDSRKFTNEEIRLAELAVEYLCELLVTHPNFNYAQNIAQSVTPFLNNPNKNVREIVKVAVKQVFKEDKKQEVTLKILRLINNYMKNHAHNVNTDMLEVLLALNLKNVNLDEEKEHNIKEKKLKGKKGNILQMSKKERKRKKKLQLLEQEMLETKAEESKQAKNKNLAEITKIVFGIYFRILKNSNNTKVLGVCLEGLAKFSHCINLDFYIDLVNILDKLLKEDWIGYREQLHCIQTVFSILSGQGEALNVDPTRFYTSLYKDLFTTNAGKNHDNFIIVLKTLTDALIKRRKKITNKRIIGFIKRLTTLSLQLLHNSALGSLSLIKTLMQLDRTVDILLDLDSSVGDGQFQAELDDPEYANASSTALYELTLLANHYHPVVVRYARNIAHGVPTTGDGSLPPEYGKCSADQLYKDFSMSEMAFNPPVPVMKNLRPKVKESNHQFADASFEDYCNNVAAKGVKRKFHML